MRRDAEKGVHPIYISGVGTEYNGKASGWLASAGVWFEDNITGLAAGGGGARRLAQGDDQVSTALANVLITRAQKFSRETAAYAAQSSEKGFAELNEALGQHRLIKVIDVSLFGFSRGAALARAFSNRVLKHCKREGDGLVFEGYPLRQSFLGIFDTVASFGVPSKNVRLPFEERELIVSPLVERCVHYVAAHEVRFSFPVDLIRKNGTLAGEWVENVYPGVHSDVGGGYGPSDQGIDNNFSRIPMRDMMREAVVSGVRMKSYEQIRDTEAPLFEERFECKASTEAAYRNYLAACGAMSGTIENQVKRHLQVFYSANGTMHRKGIETPGERRRDESALKYKYLGPKGMAYEIDMYRRAVKMDGWVRFGNKDNSGYAQFIKPEDWQIAAWDKPASDGVVDFVSRFVHDSKVDFIGNIEPFSYFRPRGILESNISIWAEWGNWMGSKRDAAVQAVGGAYDSAKREVGEAVDATTQAATDAADAVRREAEAAAAAAQRKAAEAADYARHKAEEAAAAAKRTYDAGVKAASEAAEAAQRHAEEAAAYARRQAQAAADAIHRGYDATTKAGRDAATAAGRKAGEIADDAEQLYDRGINWIRQTSRDLRNMF